jgi:hypothetical protein
VINSLLSTVPSKARRDSDRPWTRLLRLFIGRMFHGNSDRGDGELSMSVGLILSYLPFPGGIYSIFLLEKYSTLSEFLRGSPGSDPLRSALPDEYFFIVLSMVVTGVVAVWRWESIFPDKRDYLNLVPLPLSMRKIFLANLASVLGMAAILAIDVNAGSALLFPVAVGAYVNSFSFFLHFLWVHICVTILASLFSFFAVFMTAGIVMVLSPATLYRRASLYLRVTLIGGLVAVLATSFAVPAKLATLPDSFVRLLPTVWFLGLCQLIRGTATASLARLGQLSLIATGIVLAAGITAYAIGYRKCFVRIPESMELPPAARASHPLSSWAFRILDRAVLKTPFERAGYRFVMRTLFRSENHTLVLGGFFGLGIVTASQFLFASFTAQSRASTSLPAPEVLAVPLILSYCIMLGVRFAFELPTDLRANWAFQLWVDREKHECIALGKRVMLSFVLPWITVVAFPLYTYFWGVPVALLHTLVVTLWSVLLSDILLLRFRKVPFTCPFPEFHNAAAIAAIWYVLGFVAFAMITSQLEYWSLLHPGVTLVLLGAAAGMWYGISRLRGSISEVDKRLQFDPGTETGFELLNLQRGD